MKNANLLFRLVNFCLGWALVIALVLVLILPGNDSQNEIVDADIANEIGQVAGTQVSEPAVDASSAESTSAQFSTSSYQGWLFDQYLQQKESPLAGYGQEIVAACQEYGAPPDCTLLIAIAKVETNYCKTDISASQFNCWGFGGSGPNRILYDNFPQAISSITARLMDGYGYNFFENPVIGQYAYCGSHCHNWGTHVQSEINILKQYLRENGVVVA